MQAMLQRRLASAAGKLLLEGQAGAVCTGFSRQQLWQPLPLPSAAAAAPPSGARWHSDLAERKPEGQQDFVYEAPFRTLVTRVKKLSLFSCACAIGAGPVILGLDATTTLTAKASIVGTLASFGVFTTGLLTWFTQPYVTRLRYDRSTEGLEVTTLTLWARPRTDAFHVSEVREAATLHPLTSFQAHGRKYYIDADHFADKALLARLQPAAAAAHVMEAASAVHQAQQGQQQQQQQEGQQAAQPQ